MHQRRGLESLSRRLERHFVRGQFSEFVIHKREQFVGRLGITELKRLQDTGDLRHDDNSNRGEELKKVEKSTAWKAATDRTSPKDFSQRIP